MTAFDLGITNIIFGYVVGSCKYAYRNIMASGPYHHVINCNNTNNYKETTTIMNKINCGKKIDDKFEESTKILVSYMGEKKFYAVLFGMSHDDIHQQITKIIKNFDDYPKKKFKYDVSNIFLILNDNTEINITDLTENIIEYNDVTFHDLTLFLKINPCEIKDVKFEYIENIIDKKEKFIRFNKHLNLFDQILD